MIKHYILLIPVPSVSTDKTLKNKLDKNARILSAIPVVCADGTYMHYVLEQDIPNHRPIKDTITKAITFSLEHLHTTAVQKYVGQYVYLANSLEDYHVPLEISILAPIYDEDTEYEDELTGLRYKYMRPAINYPGKTEDK